jgi:hypothetical protein
MNQKLKYFIILVPVIGVIAMAAMFGKIGVRPRSLPIIKPSGFASPTELGFWSARQTRQKLFRNNLVFFGLDPRDHESASILNGFVNEFQKVGPAFQVLISEKPMSIAGVENIVITGSPEKLSEAINQQLNKSLRVLVVSETPDTSKLLKNSLVRKMEFEFGQRLAAFSVVSQKGGDLSSLKNSGLCDQYEKLSLESAETLNCFFNGVLGKLEKQFTSDDKKLAGGLDQFGLDDYLIYVYRR